MTIDTITTEMAPKAIGPYSQAISTEGLIFVSGQIAIQPINGEFLNGSISQQTHQVLANIESILNAADSSLDKVVKTTVYLKDLGDFEEMNKIYAEHFPGHKPARATVEVAKLPKGASVEIDAIAVK